MNEAYLDYFARYIESELGIVYSKENYFQLQTRLEDVMKFYSLPTMEALYKVAKGGISAGMKQLILDLATNNETFFFRDTKVFQGLSSFVFPEIFSRLKEGEPLRIWSAACSFGQEPYSLAIALQELKQKLKVPKIEIVATDISTRAIERAKAAKYSQLEVQRGLPITLLIKYFKKDTNDYWTLKPEITSLVKFQQKNLKDPFSDLGKFHLVLCRNVLIYQKVESKIDIISRIGLQLNHEGCLILGSSESLIGISQDYSQTIRDGMILHKKAAASSNSSVLIQSS